MLSICTDSIKLSAKKLQSSFSSIIFDGAEDEAHLVALFIDNPLNEDDEVDQYLMKNTIEFLKNNIENLTEIPYDILTYAELPLSFIKTSIISKKYEYLKYDIFCSEDYRIDDFAEIWFGEETERCALICRDHVTGFVFKNSSSEFIISFVNRFKYVGTDESNVKYFEVLN